MPERPGNNNTKNQEKASAVLAKLILAFQTGELPAAIAQTVITGPGRPSARWSLGNRIIMFLAGTEDARGFQQWQQVGRRVKKGAKAFYILAPTTRTVRTRVREVDPETGEEVEREVCRQIITGFRYVPVFRYEDTEGDPLPSCKPSQPPPLMDVARRFVNDIRYEPFMGGWYGAFSPGRSQIVLATHDAHVFFHELAHAVHHQVRPGGLQGGQQADQEIVAEVVACALCELYGYQGYLWHGWQYIQHYACDGEKALRRIMAVLAEVEKVLLTILDIAEPTNQEEKIA
ncbi:hypothetical protein [Desulfurispora thermophila]|uniref:hypothetical protein n=1 Tax=Desulfurispora thermophila TaxID=265470 RepID=UPI000365D274|nr:hypothetical protein [Desulfurispora thermophila]